VVGVEWGGWALSHPEENAVLVQRMVGLLDEGRLHPTAPTAFPLDEGPQVLARLVARDLDGKAVLVP
jgi:NADPH:quinone reductase-like Zn-dependent oxidoreductase